MRIVQAIPNVEFRAEVKFDSLPTSKYQSRGLLIEQDSANYLRFHFGFGNSLDVNASKILSHAQTIQFSSAISVPSGTTALWLRVQRNGNNWTLSWSPNGSSYNTVGTFTQSLTVASIAPFAGNYNATASAAPAFAVRIDAFIAGP